MNHLHISWYNRDTRGNNNINTTVSGNQPINAPLSVAVSILIDLEPDVASTSIRLGKVDEDRTFMGGVYDVVCGCNGVVVPLNADGRTSYNKWSSFIQRLEVCKYYLLLGIFY